MHQELKDAGAGDLLLWLLRRRQRFSVTGDSMTPLLNPGNEVLVDPNAYRSTVPRPGDIVVARHPLRPRLKVIKRVVAVLPDGRCQLQGDNPLASTDSRSFGPVLPEQILGRVTVRFA